MNIWTLSGSQLQRVVLTNNISGCRKMALTMTILLLVGYVARHLAANWASWGNWLEWVVHHSSGSSFTAIGLLGIAMMAIPLIPDCRFCEAHSGLSVLVCPFWNNDGGAPHAVCLQRGVRCWQAMGPPVVHFVLQKGREIILDRHIVVWVSLSGAIVGSWRVAHGLSNEKQQTMYYLADG